MGDLVTWSVVLIGASVRTTVSVVFAWLRIRDLIIVRVSALKIYDLSLLHKNRHIKGAAVVMW